MLLSNLIASTSSLAWWIVWTMHTGRHTPFCLGQWKLAIHYLHVPGLGSQEQRIKRWPLLHCMSLRRGATLSGLEDLHPRL